jgi:hypothetical protein
VRSFITGSVLSGSTNTEPGAVATGSNVQMGLVSCYSFYVTRRLTLNPVATAPGSVFVDPRLNTGHKDKPNTLSRRPMCETAISCF